MDTTKVYRFCTQVSPHPIGLDAIPSITSVNISPSRIDLKGGLGVRSNVSVSFSDHPSSDVQFGVDKYVTERTFIALERGTFWSKLRARNPNYQFKAMRVLDGFLVDGVFDAANFEIHHFVINQIDVSGGRARVTGKDPLKLVSSKKAQAPKPSTGQLSADINAVVTSLTLIPVGVGNLEYDASGFILIKAEILSFTRSNDVMTVVRGVKNTIAANHSTDTTVQQCLEYSGSTRGQLDFMVNDLMTNFANIDPVFIPLAAWDSEVNTFLSGLLDGIIPKPMDVFKILKELSEAMPHYLWWDDRTNLIQLTALKAPPASANVLDMDSNLVADRVRITDKPNMRVSTVFVSFGQINPTKKLDEVDNWEQTYVRVDTESIDKFGSGEVQVVNSRWINSNNKATAIQLAALIGRRFANIPRNIRFSLDVKDSDVWIGQSRSINYRDIVDFSGLPVDTIFQIISADPGVLYTYEALEYVYGGALSADIGVGEPGVDLIIISVDDQNINLRTIYDSLFTAPDASTKAKFVIEGGVVIGSTSNAVAGLDTGSWPVGAIITVDNSGHIVGKGGDGQNATDTPLATVGGTAIEMNFPLSLNNLLIIGGGGGGGGFAAAPLAIVDGSGGAGSNVGFRGGSFSYSGEPGALLVLIESSDGTLEVGGAFGNIRHNTGGLQAARGGKGGDLGVAGGTGIGDTESGSGAAPGSAIVKNGNVLTLIEAGDIRGAIV